MHNAELGDYIGVESFIEFKPEIPELAFSNDNDAAGATPSRRRRHHDAAAKEYPPSIPFLARTENLPWVMKKYSTGDGRLVIEEEKVKRHEYFEAHRSNGRLVLNLIVVDEVVEENVEEEIEGYMEEKGDCAENVGEEIDGGDEENGDPTVGECCVYKGIGGNPCGGFAVAVEAFRAPVQTT